MFFIFNYKSLDCAKWECKTLFLFFFLKKKVKEFNFAFQSRKWVGNLQLAAFIIKTHPDTCQNNFPTSASKRKNLL